MIKDKIIYNIKELENELSSLVIKRDNTNSDEEKRSYILRESEISRKISTLEWQLKDSSEKQEYRKMMINISKKWGSMKGSIPQENEKMRLEYYVELYDLSQEILKKTDAPDRVCNVLRELISQIDMEL